VIFVLKPTTIAFEAAASMMSLSVMSPCALMEDVEADLVLVAAVRALCVIAPSDPDTSALRMIRSSLAWPAWIWL
jgi:hypothetical protein